MKTKWQRYGMESNACVCLIRGCEAALEAKALLVFT